MITYPIDTMKRKLQINDLGRSVRFDTFNETFKHTITTYGYKGLISGVLGFLVLNSSNILLG